MIYYIASKGINCQYAYRIIKAHTIQEAIDQLDDGEWIDNDMHINDRVQEYSAPVAFVY